MYLFDFCLEASPLAHLSTLKNTRERQKHRKDLLKKGKYKSNSVKY